MKSPSAFLKLFTCRQTDLQAMMERKFCISFAILCSELARNGTKMWLRAYFENQVELFIHGHWNNAWRGRPVSRIFNCLVSADLTVLEALSRRTMTGSSEFYLEFLIIAFFFFRHSNY